MLHLSYLFIHSSFIKNKDNNTVFMGNYYFKPSLTEAQNRDRSKKY